MARGCSIHAYKDLFLWKNEKKSNQYKNPGKCYRIILKRILEK
jgi:hypothetical protein